MHAAEQHQHIQCSCFVCVQVSRVLLLPRPYANTYLGLEQLLQMATTRRQQRCLRAHLTARRTSILYTSLGCCQHHAELYTGMLQSVYCIWWSIWGPADGAAGKCLKLS